MLINNLDKWDRRVFNQSMESHVEMKEVEKLGTSKVYNFADFMLDVYGGLYKFAPDVRSMEDAPENEKWADALYSEISQLPEWKNLRERTKLNPDVSAAAATEFCFRFVDALPKSRPRREKAPNGNTYEYQNEPAVDLSEFDMSQVRRVARDACEHAVEKADQIVEMLDAFAYSGDGKPQYASPNLKREVAQRLYDNRQLQRIAELAGRMRRIAAEKQKQKTRHGVDELADIKVGDDLARLIPAEIAKLSHPLLKMDFRKKFLEKSLLQYELRGREKLGRGPLVVCVDESSSMEGDKDVWAKAVAMALLQIAMQQNRKYSMIHFSGSVSRIDNFSRGTEPAEIMDAVTSFSGGGTNFSAPLNQAMVTINKNKEFKNADIVFITDGEAAVSEEFVELIKKNKKEHSFQIISVVISARAPTCELFSDTIVSINNIRDDDEALDVMFSV